MSDPGLRTCLDMDAMDAERVTGDPLAEEPGLEEQYGGPATATDGCPHASSGASSPPLEKA